MLVAILLLSHRILPTTGTSGADQQLSQVLPVQIFNSEVDVSNHSSPNEFPDLPSGEELGGEEETSTGPILISPDDGSLRKSPEELPL